MILRLLGHHHGGRDRVIHRLPAGAKLLLALGLITVTALAPASWSGWYAGVGLSLVVVGWASRVPLGFLGRRLLVLSPLVLGVALVNAVQPVARVPWPVLLVKSGLCLVTVLLLAQTTPFHEMVRVLRRVRVPGLLLTTLALTHRYLFVLAEEAERMRQARASRTLAPGRRLQWHTLAAVVAPLFVRASERAERIYAAMCARGWR